MAKGHTRNAKHCCITRLFAPEASVHGGWSVRGVWDSEYYSEPFVLGLCLLQPPPLWHRVRLPRLLVVRRCQDAGSRTTGA